MPDRDNEHLTVQTVASNRHRLCSTAPCQGPCTGSSILGVRANMPCSKYWVSPGSCNQYHDDWNYSALVDLWWTCAAQLVHCSGMHMLYARTPFCPLPLDLLLCANPILQASAAVSKFRAPSKKAASRDFDHMALVGHSWDPHASPPKTYFVILRLNRPNCKGGIVFLVFITSSCERGFLGIRR